MSSPYVKTWFPFFLIAAFFIILKLSSLGIRASDTNIYFYTSYELLKGKILYKDVFFTNFPLIPYVASFYSLVSGGNLLFYYFTAAIETIITGGLLYFITIKQTKSRLVAAVTTCLYLISFIVLSTSDHQTGVFLAALCITASYLCLITKRFILIGVFTALALLTKAYALPLLLSYILFFLLTDRKKLLPFSIGGIITALLLLLPSIISAPHELINDVFIYSLTRSQGISKLGIVYFVLQHDIFFVLLLFGSILAIRKNTFIGLFSLFSLLFFTLYKDVYYLYLNITLPILCLSLPYFLKFFQTKFSLSRFLIPTIIFIFLCYNLISYFSGYTSLEKLPVKDLSRTVSKQQTSVIYGINGIATALAYTEHLTLLDNIVDTNDNIYRKGYLHASTLTRDAIKQHAMVVTQGVWYPEQGVTQDVMTEIVDTKLLVRNCHLLRRFPFQSEGIINSINLFAC